MASFLYLQKYVEFKKMEDLLFRTFSIEFDYHSGGIHYLGQV